MHSVLFWCLCVWTMLSLQSCRLAQKFSLINQWIIFVIWFKLVIEKSVHSVDAIYSVWSADWLLPANDKRSAAENHPDEPWWPRRSAQALLLLWTLNTGLLWQPTFCLLHFWAIDAILIMEGKACNLGFLWSAGNACVYALCVCVCVSSRARQRVRESTQAP